MIADLQSIFVAHRPIAEWQVLGPFSADAPDPFPVTMAGIPPRRPVQGRDGKELRWRRTRARGNEGMVDLGSDGNAHVYAYAEVESDVERPMQFLVGSGDTMALWLNGRKLHEDRADSGWNPGAKLIESVLYPSKQIFDGYQQTLVRTKDGRTLNSAVQGETEGELTLMDAEGDKHVVRKADVDRRKVSELSLMPDGLHAGLKPERSSPT